MLAASATMKAQGKLGSSAPTRCHLARRPSKAAEGARTVRGHARPLRRGGAADSGSGVELGANVAGVVGDLHTPSGWGVREALADKGRTEGTQGGGSW